MISLTCPQCRKKMKPSHKNENRPFCSERCRVLDLGAWAEEGYKIASDEPLKNEDIEIIERLNVDPPKRH